MTAKLRSILRQTPWSLVLRCAISGGVWLFLPGWVFLLYALWLYAVPPFRLGVLLLPFLLWLISALFFLPSTVPVAVVLALLLFLILGVKDLLLIDRAAATEAIGFGLTLFLALEFFYYLGNNALGEVWVAVAFLNLLIFGLLLIFFRSLGGRLAGSSSSVKPVLASGLLALMLSQLAWVLLFLPLNFLDQTALYLLAAVSMTELAANYFKGSLGRRNAFLTGAIFLVFGVIILATNQWSL